jgi:5-oxoprolinase (ATP-hydrolysing)
MSRPIRGLTEARGFETAHHNLATFGGAGGQHACEIAQKLGIGRIVIHKYSSILSAYGMALAEVVQEAQEPSSETLSEAALPGIYGRLEALEAKTAAGLTAQGTPEGSIEQRRYLNLRYHGTDTHFMIEQPADGDWLSALEREHQRELSFTFPRTRSVHVDDIRVRGIGKASESTTDNDKLVDDLASLTFAPVAKTVQHTVVSLFSYRLYSLLSCLSDSLF